MASSVLSRYLNPDVLSRVADRAIEPRGLVLGNFGNHDDVSDSIQLCETVKTAGRRLKACWMPIGLVTHQT